MSTMKQEKRRKLTKKGWRVGSVKEFLGLSDEEARFVELKLALSLYLRKQRVKKRLTQQQLASLLESSQSRVAKMETCDPSVSLDLLVRALLQLGTTKKELAKAISEPQVA
jgi:hypothetical protein